MKGLGLLAGGALLLALLVVAARAQTAPPSPTGGAAEAAAAGVVPAQAPGLGQVKAVVKDSVKDIIPKFGGGVVPSAPPAAPVALPQDPAARATVLRRKNLKDDDFIEDERNRDPFRSYIGLFTAKEGPRAPKVPAIFEKFALEELSLIAIVSGDAHPRAMFRDPGGLGQTIKRGDYVSKAGVRVAKILSDRVVLEVNELTANGETRVLEKAILVNPEANK